MNFTLFFILSLQTLTCVCIYNPSQLGLGRLHVSYSVMRPVTALLDSKGLDNDLQETEL